MKQVSFLSALLFVAIASYWVFVPKYWVPGNFIWDENYHIASAQKYLNGIFFMEPHPPLGKLLVALGEYLIDANSDDKQFVGTDHAASAPRGFSFRGYRLFPVMMAFLAGPLFFVLFYLITGRCWWSICFAMFYVLDNAGVAHYRTAMLDSQQMFFALLYLITFMLMWRSEYTETQVRLGGIAAGGLLAAILAVKINGLVLGILWGALLWSIFRFRRGSVLSFVACSSWAFLAVSFVVWQIHFSLASSPLESLSGQGFYRASDQARVLLRSGESGSPGNLPVMLADALRFMRHYQKGVPRLNLCNDDENGSPPYFWPFGARAIDYRWKRNGEVARYIYLVANPVCWAVGLFGVIAAAIALGARLFFGQHLRDPALLSLFFSMYVSYMAMVLQVDRVFYLYHYFLPLYFSYILGALALREIRSSANSAQVDGWKSGALFLVVAAGLAAFIFFKPLSYYQPINNADFLKRTWLTLWNLRCAGCPGSRSLAFSLCDPGEIPSPDVKISGLQALHASQQWGKPKQDESVEGRQLIVSGRTYPSGIGVHARSSIKFVLAKRFKRFAASAGIPDYVKSEKSGAGSVVFEVLGDGVSLWKSELLKSGDEPVSVEVEVSSVERLELKVSDAGDGIDNDHAAWLVPDLK